MHILVVDDEPFNREILAEVLDDPAYRISVAEDGGQAWDRLTADGESFDLVLLDRMMPGMDGLEVLRRMKDTPRLRDLPVIMQTAAASPDQVREGIAAGAYYYLTKPFELETLLTIVRAALDDA
ncbi:MAG: response regulator, partial [Rhodocyclaceae bacterium]|nr:response regulator [Rhodocyclaceae bacterium]